MKKGLLGSTALVAATALTAGAAQAQEAPTISLSGFINFQAYIVDQDPISIVNVNIITTTTLGVTFFAPSTTTITNAQDGGVYFGVDDAELHVNVRGTADNGLEYGAKIEFEGSPGGSNVADEARIQLGGSWGTLQLGDEDGAEDIMNYGGENVMGATGGFDGDQDDWYINIGDAPSFPTIAGDSSDHTKISYFSPRFSGIQVGASWTPSLDQDGDEFKIDGRFENHIGLGANYDGSFGNVRIRVSGVYSAASQSSSGIQQQGAQEDIAAYSIGTIVGFGPFQVGANWTDNGESGAGLNSGLESSYWNVAAGFETGPLYLSAGYLASVADSSATQEDEYNHIAVAADYTVAPGLTVYAEYSDIESKIGGTTLSNDGTGFILGMNLSF